MPEGIPQKYAIRAYLNQRESGAHINVYLRHDINQAKANEYISQFGNTALIVGNSISLRVDPLYDAEEVQKHLNSFNTVGFPSDWKRS